MPADGLTKALPRQKHEIFIKQLGLVDIATTLKGLKAGGVCQQLSAEKQP